MKSKVSLCMSILLFIGVVFMWKKVFFVHTASDFYIWGILLLIFFILLIVFLLKDFYPKKINRFVINIYANILLISVLFLEVASYCLCTIHFPNVKPSNINKIMYYDINNEMLIQKNTSIYESITEYLESFNYVKECSDDGIVGTMDKYYEVYLCDGGILQFYYVNEKQNTVFCFHGKEMKIFKVEQ